MALHSQKIDKLLTNVISIGIENPITIEANGEDGSLHINDKDQNPVRIFAKSATLQQLSTPTISGDVNAVVTLRDLNSYVSQHYIKKQDLNEVTEEVIEEIFNDDETGDPASRAVSWLEVGQPNGVAALDDKGKVPAAQLPSYVDDVLEGTLQSTTVFIDLEGNEYTPESGKIYVDVNTNNSYRWSGSIYTAVGKSLALGETAQTAYPGDKGKANADNIKSILAKLKEIDGFESYARLWIEQSKYKSHVCKRVLKATERDSIELVNFQEAQNHLLEKIVFVVEDDPLSIAGEDINVTIDYDDGTSKVILCDELDFLGVDHNYSAIDIYKTLESTAVSVTLHIGQLESSGTITIYTYYVELLDE